MTRIVPLAIAALILTACGSGEDNNSGKGNVTTKEPPRFQRSADFAMVNKGHNLYQKHCGACHGSEGQGAPNWQQVGPDGNYPPPPLNGTGHAWHHPRAALVRTIKHGTIAIGGKMPGWDDKLSDEDIASVIAWFQSRWPDELYQAWARMDQQSRQK